MITRKIYITVDEFLNNGGVLKKGRTIYWLHPEFQTYYPCGEFVAQRGDELIGVGDDGEEGHLFLGGGHYLQVTATVLDFD